MQRTVSRPAPAGSRRRRVPLAAYAGAVAVSAYAGTVGLATGVLALGGRLDHRLPLHSPVLGGLALAVIVGGPATLVAGLAARGDARTDRAAIVAGVLLIAWIAVELAFIREFSPLQPFYAAVGASFVAAGRHAPRTLPVAPRESASR